MNTISVHSTRHHSLDEFLSLNGFEVEEVDTQVYRVIRDDELPVFLSITDSSLYFSVDLGNISDVASAELYQALLDLNTEIQPVSFGIDSTNAEDPRLVLVESRISGDLSDEELLSVFSALELATDQAEALLSSYLK
ncbi:MAG: type III secretion system chaperone [Opitutales bacterium]|nr:type III secretion system chaperone [Opitutales bacterium]NRA26021.1 CesT family type III secretion system chaperone [Opitutales bacterium]